MAGNRDEAAGTARRMRIAIRTVRNVMKTVDASALEKQSRALTLAIKTCELAREFPSRGVAMEGQDERPDAAGEKRFRKELRSAGCSISRAGSARRFWICWISRCWV